MSDLSLTNAFIGPILVKKNFGVGDTSTSVGNEAINAITDTVKDGVSVLIENSTGLSAATSDQVADFIVNATANGIGNALSKPAGNTGDYFNGGGGGLNIDTSPNSVSPNNPRLAVYLDQSVKVSIETNINNNAYDSKYATNIENDFSTCHNTGGKIVFNNSNTTLYNFVLTQLMPAFQAITQRNLNFAMPVTVTAARVIAYLNLIAEALQLFYYHSATFAYTNNPSNFNEAINFERSMLTSADSLNLGNLKFFLGTVPIPPNLKLLCAWFCQIYASTDMPGCTLFRFNPIGFTTTGSNAFKVDTARLSTIIGDFSSYQDVTNVMSKAFPAWVEPMSDSSSVAMIDNNFKTLWANFIGVSTTGAGVIHFGLPNSQQNDPYANFNPTLDGLVTSMFSYYLNGTTLRPGVIEAITCPDVNPTGLRTNQASFVSTASAKGYLNSYIYSENHRNCRTYCVLSSTTYLTAIADGGAPYFGVLAQADNAVYQFYEWVMSFDYMASSKANLTKVNPSKGRSKKRNFKG